MTISALIPAAGISKRFSETTNKLLFRVKGKSILEHSVYAFDSILSVNEIIIVTNKEAFPVIEAMFKGKLRSKLKIVLGGKERQDSVRNGLEAVTNEYVLIHDGARPCVSKEIIENSISELKNNDAIVVCVPTVDTIKVCKNDFVVNTPNRKDLYLVQTPQGFRTSLIKDLHKKAIGADYSFTDDASICEWGNIPVKVVKGDYKNIKVTTKSDINLLRTYFGENMIRIGTGYDVHQLAKNRKLILGGVEIPYEYGLLGHSDADVLLHAITDALLGALALGDLGKHFPPSDNRYKDIDSMILLDKAYSLIKENGYNILNIDSILIAQKPKLSPYIDQMRENISRRLNLNTDCVSVKATTTEHLGFEGRCEGISSQASVLLNKI